MHLSIDACWYLDQFIWITVSSSGAWDNEMYTINNHMVRDESIIDFTLFKLTATI